MDGIKYTPDDLHTLEIRLKMAIQEYPESTKELADQAKVPRSTIYAFLNGTMTLDQMKFCAVVRLMFALKLEMRL